MMVPRESIESSGLRALAERLLEPAFRRTDKVDLGHVLADAERGYVQLWVIAAESEPIGMLVTDLRDHPNRRVCRIFAAGGHDAAKWLDVLPQLESWARTEGACALEVAGRPGWGRILEGFSEIERVFSKELTDA